MINYYKYLPVSAEDMDWGLCVLNAGCSRINKMTVYPAQDHPSHHNFNWNRGRILDEYQVIYITKGAGIFESKSCQQQFISKGDIIMLFPGEWHRFKPDIESGWDEYWVGFKGVIVENLIKKNYFHPLHPLLTLGMREKIYNIFFEIIEQAKLERAGYQPLISGLVMQLLGTIYSLNKLLDFKQEDNIEEVVDHARTIFRSKINQDISIETVAAELKVSYSWFRKVFKAYTGIAPGQYFLELKIERARMLLSDPSKSIKQIAFELNFESENYFSRFFKEKTGIPPGQYRKNI